MTLPAEHPAAGTRDSRQWARPHGAPWIRVAARRRTPGFAATVTKTEELPCSLT